MIKHVIVLAVCSAIAFITAMYIISTDKKTTLDLYKEELAKEEKGDLKNIVDRTLFSEVYKKILQEEFADAEIEAMKKPLLHKGTALCTVVHEETGICYAEEFLNKLEGLDLEIIQGVSEGGRKMQISLKDRDKLRPNVYWDECKQRWMKNDKEVTL